MRNKKNLIWISLPTILIAALFVVIYSVDSVLSESSYLNDDVEYGGLIFSAYNDDGLRADQIWFYDNGTFKADLSNTLFNGKYTRFGDTLTLEYEASLMQEEYLPVKFIETEDGLTALTENEFDESLYLTK